MKVKYFNPNLTHIQQIPQGDWLDLRCAANTEIKKGEMKLIPLGVAIQLPPNTEAYLVPRSSTFKNYKVIQVNGVGIIDNSYCGDNDQWFVPFYATEDTFIPFNERICQFRVQQKSPYHDVIEEVERLDNQD